MVLSKSTNATAQFKKRNVRIIHFPFSEMLSVGKFIFTLFSAWGSSVSGILNASNAPADNKIKSRLHILITLINNSNPLRGERKE